MSTDLNLLQAALKHYWGYDQFRPPQAEVMQSLLSGRDSLVVLPTGAGKSICFQLPALLQTGVTLVISPLLALMENQVAELQQRQLPAATLHSELTPPQRQQVLQKLRQQKLRLLYLSPETLLSSSVWEQLCQPNLEINGIILDEAHCLVQWGDSFRPAYRRLGAVRPALLKPKPVGTQIPIAAFTATAEPNTQQTIRQVLALHQPQIFRYSPYRHNLLVQVKRVWSPAQRRQQLWRFIQTQGQSTGLVYTRSRSDTETLAAWLNDQGAMTAAYHAGLGAKARRHLEAQWLEGHLPFVICTSAFGMGINKSSTRWICHFHAPLTLPEYIQEIGRAGRDGQPAIALTLVSEPTGWLDPSDQQRQKFFQTQLQEQANQAQALSSQLPSQGDIRDLNPTDSQLSSQLGIALALLHSRGQVVWQDPFHFQLRPRSVATSINPSAALAPMQAYLRLKTCRWQFLLTSFGFERQAQGFRCGHCDNCQRR
jgi:ATP-dependent DNA helicase RecQ